MKKQYVSPEFEVVSYSLKDVLSGSPLEGDEIGNGNIGGGGNAEQDFDDF